MCDKDLLDCSTVPWYISWHVEIEDYANLSTSIDRFRAAMDQFMDLKNKALKAHTEKAENLAIHVQ